MAVGSRMNALSHVLERTGLAAAGAACGLFVAAHLAKAGVESLSSTEFVLAMMILGAIGFYLGIHLPARGAENSRRAALQVGPVEPLSAIGTFLAPVAALLSVYYIIFDVDARHIWSVVIGLSWLSGVTLQIIAGTIARFGGQASRLPSSAT